MIDLRLLTLRDLRRREAEQIAELQRTREAIERRQGQPFATPEQSARLLGVRRIEPVHPFNRFAS